MYSANGLVAGSNKVTLYPLKPTLKALGEYITKHDAKFGHEHADVRDLQRPQVPRLLRDARRQAGQARHPTPDRIHRNLPWGLCLCLCLMPTH